jgi:hypothetical protein
MDDSVLAFFGFVTVFVVLAVAALRFGVDSRRLTRERPLPGEPVVRIPFGIGRHPRAPLTLEALREHSLPAGPAAPWPLAPIARVHRLSRPKRPTIASDVNGSLCFAA